MTPRTFLRLSRPSTISVSVPFAATTCLSSRIPRFFSQPRLHAPLTTDASSSNTSSIHQQPPPPPPSSATTESQPCESTPFPPSFTTTSFTAPSKPISRKFGTVLSAGQMDKVVRVEYAHQQWDKNIRRFYPKKTIIKVADPRNSLRAGDVIEFTSGYRTSKTVRHVVERIVAPFGVGIEERPAVMTPEERAEERNMKSKKGQKEIRLGKVKKRVLERLLAEEKITGEGLEGLGLNVESVSKVVSRAMAKSQEARLKEQEREG